MITIQIDGKTYIPGAGNSLSMQNIIKYAIADGNLQEKAEEVKENKKEIDHKDYMPHEECTWNPDPSILEKLREELERMKNWKKNMSVGFILSTFDNLLNPIETKEEPRPQEDTEFLPEFKTDKGDTSREQRQIELLTNTVNKLIKANKK